MNRQLTLVGSSPFRNTAGLFLSLPTVLAASIIGHGGQVRAEAPHVLDGLSGARSTFVATPAPAVMDAAEIQRRVAHTMAGLDEELGGHLLEPMELAQEPDGDDAQLSDVTPPDSEREQLIPSEAPSGSVESIEDEQEVAISEVVVTGLAGHPEQTRLEAVAYDNLKVKAGETTTRTSLERDITAIYATGWFSDVRVKPTDTFLGVKLEVEVTPNPVLAAVKMRDDDALLPAQLLEETFAPDIGSTINLLTVQDHIKTLEEWYAEQGYSLARISLARISQDAGGDAPRGTVELAVRQGTVNSTEVVFMNEDGETENEDGKAIRSKTKPWVIQREISTKAGGVFNRQALEEDLERLYATGLFADIQVSLEPLPSKPGEVVIVLKVQETKTGSLSGGIGYSGNQGVFGQVQLSEDNFLGRSWKADLQVTYGQYGTLLDLSFRDPWIKGDPYRTSFRTNVFVSRETPLQFLSDDDDDITLVDDYYKAARPTQPTVQEFQADSCGSTNFADIGGDPNCFNQHWYRPNGGIVRLQREGGNFQVIRPLNGGDPFKKARWTVSLGTVLQKVTIQDSDVKARTYAKGPGSATDLGTDDFFCVGYNCKKSNFLAGIRVGALYNSLDSNANPTRGDFISVSSEQYISIGDNSPTFNRLQASYAHFIPLRLLRLSRGCRPKEGEVEDCPQTIGLKVSGGALLGNSPPYESFCMGGSSSIRGFYECSIGPGTSFGEATAEYRFPIFKILSGELFVDAGSVFGSQADVQGNPGELLSKSDSGVGYGAGLVVSTPLGPLRAEYATNADTKESRFNFGVGWKF